MNFISLVVPCYRSSKMISPLVGRSLSANSHFENFELILVDDGSDDSTWDEIKRECLLDSRVRGYRLDRNYGEHSALWAGYAQARGKFIFSIDDDLQHDPFDLALLLEKLRSGTELVYGQYRINRHSLPRRIGSLWNGWAGTMLFGRPFGLHLSSFRGMTRPLLDRCLKLEPGCRYVDGALLRHAETVGTVPIQHHEGNRESRYDYSQLFGLHCTALLSGLSPRGKEAAAVKETAGCSR
jgi:polyisoprenyl-phosphate glycosyltransferase